MRYFNFLLVLFCVLGLPVHAEADQQGNRFFEVYFPRWLLNAFESDDPVIDKTPSVTIGSLD